MVVTSHGYNEVTHNNANKLSRGCNYEKEYQYLVISRADGVRNC